MILASLLALSLAGCATVPAPTPVGPAPDGIVTARLGQTVHVDGPRVTPLKVLEDSRCPMNARCVWAGQVRLKVRVHLGKRDETVELVSNKPVPIADGSLELVEVQPDRIAGEPIDQRVYRFGLRFRGGL